ncbi:MAG TPA: hypothetical protein VNH18_17305 [Bryobacteraceae bacterium]|nr:hypothetical protein [Bryobacteraceae bacterium]
MSETVLNAEELEVVPGFEHQNLQGQVFAAASPEELKDALEKAFDYRGDVTIQLKDGSSVEGYIFDRRVGATLAESVIRMFPKNDAVKRSIAWSEISGLGFTGRDTAAGKTWEAWLKKYWEKKQAGESNIELKPESLD